MIDPQLEAAIGAALSRNENFLAAAIDSTGTVDDLVGLSRSQNSHEGASKKNSAAEILMSRLGHIPVNPSDAGNTFFLRNSYVYANEVGDRDDRPAVNADARTVTKFADRLIAVAKESARRSLSGHHSDRKNKVISLVGPRGSGKTFFVNHLFSVHSERFDKDKVIWVRLNLISDHGFDDDLLKWSRAQIAKLLLRYYETASEYKSDAQPNSIDIISHISRWIEDTFPKQNDRDRYNDRFLSMRQVFCSTGSDEDISATLCDEAICREIFRFARSQGYSFIIAFDGFDRMDSDTLHRDRFTLLSRSLSQIVSGVAEIGACFLVVCRSQTFKAILNGNGLRPHFEETTERLSSPTFYDIVQRRLLTFEAWVEQQRDISDNKPDLYRAQEYSRNFRSHFQQRHNNGEYAKLEEALRDNNRAKIQMLMLEFRDYTQKSTGLGYRFIELMLKGGYTYPPIFYRYTAFDADKLECYYDDRVGRIIYDSRFLPIITRAPLPVDRQGRFIQDIYFQKYSILHAIRLLQILHFWGKYTDSDSVIDNLSIQEMCDTLHGMFGYNRGVTRALVYELESYECVEINRTEIVSSESDYDPIGILPKGDRIITEFIFDIAYLNICAMRTIMNSRFLEAGHIRLASMTKPDNIGSGERLSSWILCKISNSLLLANMLCTANDQQIRHSVENADLSRVPERVVTRIASKGVDDFGLLFHPMKSRILNEIDLIYNSSDKMTRFGVPNLRESIKRTVALCNSSLDALR